MVILCTAMSLAKIGSSFFFLFFFSYLYCKLILFLYCVPMVVSLLFLCSLKRLDVDYIDLYYQHQVDTSVPIEETISC